MIGKEIFLCIYIDEENICCNRDPRIIGFILVFNGR
jgi:hypothetical protein